MATGRTASSSVGEAVLSTRRCKCGSQDHVSTKSRDCALNRMNILHAQVGRARSREAKASSGGDSRGGGWRGGGTDVTRQRRPPSDAVAEGAAPAAAAAEAAALGLYGDVGGASMASATASDADAVARWTLREGTVVDYLRATSEHLVELCDASRTRIWLSLSDVTHFATGDCCARSTRRARRVVQ